MLNKLLYYLILKPISLLPHGVLYILSDIMRFFLFSLFNYRKEVIYNNIKNSFPEKSEKEIKGIVKGFNKHFCDLVIEAIKNFSISEKQLRKRFKIDNIEIFEEFQQENKSVVIIGGHTANWEMYALALGFYASFEHVGIYKPLHNKFFNEKILKSRGKYGLKLVSTRKVREFFEKLDDEGTTAISFGSDQWPRKAEKAYWRSFLNRDTAWQFGAEKYASEFKLAVVFGRIYKTKRGFYQMDFKKITDDASKLKYGETMNQYIGLLEKAVQTQPETYLWSHKRWKKTKEEVFNKQN